MNVRLTKEQKINISHPQDIFEIMRKILLRENKLGQQKEHFWVIGLAISNKLSYIELVSLGSLSAAIVNPYNPCHIGSVSRSNLDHAD